MRDPTLLEHMKAHTILLHAHDQLALLHPHVIIKAIDENAPDLAALRSNSRTILDDAIYAALENA